MATPRARSQEGAVRTLPSLDSIVNNPHFRLHPQFPAYFDPPTAERYVLAERRYATEEVVNLVRFIIPLVPDHVEIVRLRCRQLLEHLTPDLHEPGGHPPRTNEALLVDLRRLVLVHVDDATVEIPCILAGVSGPYNVHVRRE